MKKTWLITIISLAFFMSLITSISFSAVIQLKNGDKVEGDFMGGSDKAITFKVASQIIKIEVNEIAQIVFDKKISDQLNDLRKNTNHDKVISALKSLESVIEVGVNYREYSNRVLDAKVIVDDFLNRNDDTKDADFNTHISDAMGYYSAAIQVWALEFKNDFLEKKIAVNSALNNNYVKKCNYVQFAFKSEKQYSPDIIIQVRGVNSLWKCAETSLAEATEIAKN